MESIKLVIIEACKNKNYASILLNMGIVGPGMTVEKARLNLCREDWENLKDSIDDIFRNQYTKAEVYITNPTPKHKDEEPIKPEVSKPDPVEPEVDVKRPETIVKSKRHMAPKQNAEQINKIIDYYLTCGSISETANHFGLGYSSINRFIKMTSEEIAARG